MITVRLYGHLAKKFGRVHYLCIKSPAEAIRALEANYAGFKQAILDKGILGYKIIVDNQDRSSKEELYNPIDSELKIVPIVQGSGGNTNWVQVIIGIILIVVGFFTYGATWQFVPYLLAGSLNIYMGVTAVLYKPPAQQGRAEVDENRGFAFDGPQALTRAGNPIPLTYGRVLVGSLTVHAGITTMKG
jgi:predicted phage tail protein